MAKQTPHRRALRWAQGSMCAGCGEHIPSSSRLKVNDPLYPTFDHVVPRSKGGANAQTNGLLKHLRCNAARADRSPNGCDMIWSVFVRARLATRPNDLSSATAWNR
jgi:5-methylcytosine-specific restriction endonuclease McrA